MPAKNPLVQPPGPVVVHVPSAARVDFACWVAESSAIERSLCCTAKSTASSIALWSSSVVVTLTV